MNEGTGAASETAADSTRVARDVIHRSNNFLSLVVVLAENALLQQDPKAREEALRSILSETSSLESFLRRSRQSLHT